MCNCIDCKYYKEKKYTHPCYACNRIERADMFEPKEFAIEDLLYEWCPVMIKTDKEYHLNFFNEDMPHYYDIRLPRPSEAPSGLRIPHHKSLGKPEGIDNYKYTLWFEDGECQSEHTHTVPSAWDEVAFWMRES